MIFKKGIVRKTFLFSVLLVLFVVLVSFAVMYFIMPGYYLTQKGKTLQDNLNGLTRSLQSAVTEGECAGLISDFSTANNVTVLSFDENDMMLPAISTPFLGMRRDNAVFISERRTDNTDGNQTYRILVRGEKSIGSNAENNPLMTWAMTEPGENVISLKKHVGTDIVNHIVANGTLQPIDEAKDVILSLIPYVLMIAIVVGIVLSGVYAGQITKPILQISDAALKMQRMEPGVESGIKTKDELGQLSENLDVLYTKLSENIGHLQSEMDKVNRLERFKTELMQNASHELKTPIAALSGMIEGMIDNVGAYKNKEKYLAECKSQVDKLAHLVTEILGASKSDIAYQELKLSDTDVSGLAERAISENMYTVNEKNLNLELSLTDTSIVTDTDILYHSISNLISNAVRYTPSGGTIRVSITGEGEGRRFTVENECEPIPQEELPKLFEPFYTRSYSRDKTKSGTGLGLYIVKRSLERLEIPYEAKITKSGFSISLAI